MIGQRNPRWEITVSLDPLLTSSVERTACQIKLPDGEMIFVYGAQTEASEIQRLEEALRQLQAPELRRITEVHIADELGHFMSPEGSPERPIRALPPDVRGRMVLARASLASLDGLVELFTELAERERQASEEPTLTPPTGQLETVAGFFQGRPVIGPGSTISGGVCVFKDAERPAIVIDHTRDHRLARLFDQQREKLTASKVGGLRALSSRLLTRRPSEEERLRQLLENVLQHVRRWLQPWDREGGDGVGIDDVVLGAISERGEEVRPRQKIYLGEYLKIASQGNHGWGEPLHQALLAGHLLERLRDAGTLIGAISFECAGATTPDREPRVRLTTTGGEVWTLDPGNATIEAPSHGPTQNSPKAEKPDQPL